MTPARYLRCIPAALLAAFIGSPSFAQAAEEAVDFERHIRPILKTRCLACHGGVRREGGLSFLRRDEALAAGESGSRAIVPGQPDQSELLRRITASDKAERMPADGAALSAAEVQKLRRWIAQGAPWPADWAFQPVRVAAPPRVENSAWTRNPIDAFVLRRLEAAGVTPSPEADRYTLLRRLYLDLVGMPPTPEEVAAFEQSAIRDPKSAIESLVDRLLASPHFGERWGRHWLDLARYADTDGYEVDGPRPNAWHWRDWVIEAINADMPLDQFTVEQLAGDLLPEASVDQQLATAFHRQTLTNNEGGVDKEEYRVEAVIDRVNTTATVWLGLTAGCTQCHDHPHDPLTQHEFFQLYAFFNNADEGQLRLPGRGEEAYQRKQAEHEQAVAELRQQIAMAADEDRPPLEARLKQLEKQAPKDPALRLDVMVQRSQPRETHVFERGDFLRPVRTAAIEPGVPALLPPLVSRHSEGPADRLDLARWLVRPDHPLTPRVMANHIWQQLFGQGLVRTPDDFGLAGEPPTHPQLLDWLANYLVERGWSRKALVRLIVTSAAYRQASVHRPLVAARDPENKLLYRQNRLRVTGEIVTDLHLAASGLLNHRIGGASVFPPFPQDLAQIDFRSDLKWETSTGADRYRRGMYTFLKRTLPHPNLTTFDCPKAEATAVGRPVSNTPLQALVTLNNEVFLDAARALALQTLAPAGLDDRQRMQSAFRRCVTRPARSDELDRLAQLLETSLRWYRDHADDARRLAGDVPPGVDPAAAAAWTATASVILNLDEFITRE